MKIYTKTGDEGKTSLFGGSRVFKDDILVEAYGTVDEVNAVLGVAKSFMENSELKNIVQRVQNDLFTIGAELASLESVQKAPVIVEKHIQDLEEDIDEVQKHLSEQTEFIIPGGTQAAAFLQLARTVTRRAERVVVHLSRNNDVRPELLQYLNRASDLMHVLSRLANKEQAKEQQPIYKYFEK